MSQFSQQCVEEEETLRAENTKILHKLQSSLVQVLGLSVPSLNISFLLSQVLICRTAILPQLHQFWDTIWGELADKDPFTASIGGMKMKLPKLQDDNKEAMRLRSESLLESWEDIKQVLHYQSLLYIPKIICSELISSHHNNFHAGRFGIKKIRKLIVGKYYWSTLQWDIKAYVKGCEVCLTSKTVHYKLYRDLQLLPIPTHWWKNLSMDFITSLPISANWKGNSYKSIFVIVDRIIKMVHYEPVKVRSIY